jgi:hypothetical protein
MGKTQGRERTAVGVCAGTCEAETQSVGQEAYPECEKNLVSFLRCIIGLWRQWDVRRVSRKIIYGTTYVSDERWS